MTGTWMLQLRPYGSMYAGMRAALAEHDDEELQGILDATKRVTGTNCWWAIYDVAPIVEKLIKSIRAERYTAAQLAKRAADEVDEAQS